MAGRGYNVPYNPSEWTSGGRRPSQNETVDPESMLQIRMRVIVLERLTRLQMASMHRPHHILRPRAGSVLS